MIRHIAICCCSLALFASEPASSARISSTLTLHEGVVVTAPILRENSESLVLDLGYDALVVPAKRVIARKSLDERTNTADAITRRGIYQTGTGSIVPVTEHVKRFGDAVVMISTPRGLGTGFFISTEGHLVTNYHVIEGETRLTVTLFRREAQGYERHEITEVRILALQPLRDIALLQIDRSALGKTPIVPVLLHDSRSAGSATVVGDLVFAIGNPLGLERTVTQGIVSSTTRTYGHLRFVQTDASINPGNSGGPLFNARGEVVGIASMKAGFFDGLAFGIPVEDLIDFLENRDAYLYNAAQPQNGITYLMPPGTGQAPETKEKP